MSINLLVIQIVSVVNELRIKHKHDKQTETTETTKAKNTSSSSVTALVYVILEICIRDLIKYLPNLLAISGSGGSEPIVSRTKAATSSFIQMNISTCKQLNSRDVELIRCVLKVLCSLPFQAGISAESEFFSFFFLPQICLQLIYSIFSKKNASH